jgi:hypothetical protein
VTIALSLCSTRNSAAWTIAIPPSNKHYSLQQQQHGLLPSLNTAVIINTDISISIDSSTDIDIVSNIDIALPGARSPHSILVLRCPSF